MSKDLLKTATAKISSAAFNTIVFNNDNIEKSIRPELVTRTELHPIEVNGKIEDRIYYTLHNDAGDCVYVSEFLRMNPEGEDKIETILPSPSIPEEIIKPPVYPTPPAPPTNIIPDPIPAPGPIDPDNPPSWPSVITPTPGEEDEEDENPPWIPGGGGIVIGGDDDDDDDDGYTPRVPKSNFDDYAQKLVDKEWDSYIPNIDFKNNTGNVTRFYEVTYSATTAKRAMMATRNAYRNVGLVEGRPMPKLINAEQMFMDSAIHTFNAKYDKVSNAKEMFKGCSSLEIATFKGTKGAYCLTNVDDMFTDCESLLKASLGTTYRLTKASYTFYNCGSLKSVNMALTNVTEAEGTFYKCGSLVSLSEDASNLKSLSNGNYMFYKCASLKRWPQLYTGLSSARGMFSGCSSLPQFNNWTAIRSVSDGRQMFYGCSNITYADLNLPSLTDGTQMFGGCPITSISSTVNFPSLQYGNGFLGAAKLDLTQAALVLGAVSKLGPMEAKNGDVNNGFHLGVLPDVPGSANIKWEDFLTQWNYNPELNVLEFENGWQVVLNKNSL